MATYIALLRAVNLGAHNTIKMSELKSFAENIGLLNVRTVLQTGNLIFDTSKPTECVNLEAKLELAARKTLKLDTPFFVRSLAGWQRVCDDNPFLSQAERDPGHLVVYALKTKTSSDRLLALRQALKGRELIEASHQELYAVYPDGIGRSKLTAQLIEKYLVTPCSGRNWNTVLKIKALLHPDPRDPVS